MRSSLSPSRQAGMQDRLIENGFDEKFDAILVHLKRPARAEAPPDHKAHEWGTQAPRSCIHWRWSWSFRIYASVAYGAIKSAHLSEFMATPAAKFIGVQASDIVGVWASTDKLNDQDIKALESELTDPRFDTPYWKEQINLMLKIGKKAEQQAFAGRGWIMLRISICRKVDGDGSDMTWLPIDLGTWSIKLFDYWTTPIFKQTLAITYNGSWIKPEIYCF